MSGTPAYAPGSAAHEAGQRRQAKSRTRKPRSRVPEPKEIITAAGHPLDPGVRRELEARLGHDFSQVRVHTDRDSAALAELVGADAVTVGQDIFFAPGMFRPGSEDGRRLLAHELLHTVQSPHQPGALRAGRDLGAVSSPRDAAEREAERGARSDEPHPEVGHDHTPGWLRYATVRADRFRTEQLDPATLVDRLTAGILRSLRGDPADATGRVRLQLSSFADELRGAVVDRLERRLPSADYHRVLGLVEESTYGPAATDTGRAPEPVPDPAGRTGPAAETGDKAAEPEWGEAEARGGRTRAGEQEGPGKAEDGQKGDQERPGEEKRAEGKGSEGKGSEGEGPKGKDAEGKGADEEAADEKGADEKGVDGKRADERGTDEKGVDKKRADAREKSRQAAREARQGTAAADARAATGVVGAEPAGAPAAASAGESLLAAPQHQPAQGARPTEPDRRRDAEPGPARPEQVDRLAEAEDSPLKRHGLLDDDKADPREEEQPLDLEPGAGDEVEPVKDGEEAAPAPPAQPELKPEDFLPGGDPDISAVPTADRLRLPSSGSPPAPEEAPSFPEPPPTKAEQVEEERKNAPQDETEGEAEGEAEDAAPQSTAPRPEPPAGRPEAEGGPRTPAAPERAPNPASVRTTEAEADNRTARDLQPAGPVEHEVGPDPGAAEPVAADGRAPGTADQAPEADAESGAATGRSPTGAPTFGAGTATGTRTGAGPGGPEPKEPGAAGERAGGSPAALDAPGAQPPSPDASLEPGGGGCAGQQQPTTEGEKAEGGGGGCGAGQGGGEAEQKEKPEPPDVTGQDPQSALATAGTLPPDQMRSTLDGVDGAVDRSVGERHAALEADAPSAQRPSGAPRTLSGTPQEAAPAEQIRERVEREGAEGGKEQQKAEGEKARGQNPAADVSRPNVADDAANKVTADDVRNMQNAVGEVPTTDPALNARVEAPKVQLTGESDPQRTDQQADNLRKTSGRILAVGREDTAKPMGEDQIYPDVPAETLTGNVPGRGGAGGRRRGPTGAAGGGAESGAAIVAQQERGPQIQASVGQAQGRMTTEQTNQQQAETEERRRSQEEQDKAVAENAEAQSGERGEAARQVKAERAQWRTEQDQRTDQADTDAAREHTDRNKEIDTKRTDTDKEVGKRQDEDNQKIQDKRAEAEEKARKEKEDKEKESDSWWGWVKSKVKAAFDALLSVITGIFDFFRGIINGIIDKFREFANWAIDQARKFAVELINKLADALIALGDVLLAAFPELRDKFRKKIEQWRDQAIAKVNEWADKLKAAVNKLLDLLAAGLNKLLNLLEAGLKAAVNIVRDAVVAAIEFAQKAIAALGQFAALVADIAPDPGGWLAKLGSSAKEGVQNHLWSAVKTAVKQWFDEKVESVLGLGRMVIDVLVKGCVSMAQIGRMAWQALVQSLPMIIISIVVEKVISMIVPAAGAILTIVQGLMAAWGTISRIIAAFGKFFTYLKAVKAGPAACLFAEAVAAGVVALLEFITNFLLSRLKMAAKGVGGRLKAMAQKIMAGLKKATKGPRAAAGAAVNRARDALRRARQSFTSPRRRTPRPATSRTRPSRRTAAKRPTSAAGRALDSTRNAAKNALKRVGDATRRLGQKLKNSKVGRALTNSARKVRDAVKRQRDRLRERWNKRKAQRKQRQEERRQRENSPEAKERRLALILARIRPKIRRLLGRGVPRVVLRSVLAGMRVWYRLSGLFLRGDDRFGIRALLNPEDLVLEGLKLRIPQREVLQFLRTLATEIENHPAIVRASEHVDVVKKVPGTVPRHTVRQPVPPPAVTRKTRALDPLKRREQDALDFVEAGGVTSLRRTQKGAATPKKVVVGEGVLSDEQLSHTYLTKVVKGQEKIGMADELTRKNQWEGFVTYADNFFRGKPQPKDMPKKERTDMLKAAWLMGGQEVERDPQAMVTNALTVQRLVRANEQKRGSGELETIFKSMPAAFAGSEAAGEMLTEDLAGGRSIDERRSEVQTQRARELERIKEVAAKPGINREEIEDSRKRSQKSYERKMRPIRNAEKLGDRHVQSVAAWIKDFNVEDKVKAAIEKGETLTDQQSVERAKDLVFAQIRAAVIEMYTSSH